MSRIFRWLKFSIDYFRQYQNEIELLQENLRRKEEELDETNDEIAEWQRRTAEAEREKNQEREK